MQPKFYNNSKHIISILSMLEQLKYFETERAILIKLKRQRTFLTFLYHAVLYGIVHTYFDVGFYALIIYFPVLWLLAHDFFRIVYDFEFQIEYDDLKMRYYRTLLKTFTRNYHPLFKTKFNSYSNFTNSIIREKLRGIEYRSKESYNLNSAEIKINLSVIDCLSQASDLTVSNKNKFTGNQYNRNIWRYPHI